jgi:RNA recognition motif-containing protein
LIPKANNGGRSRGIGVVTMENSSTAQLTINRVNRMSFMGRHINVEMFTEGHRSNQSLGEGNTERREDDRRNRGPNHYYDDSKRSRSRSRDHSPYDHRNRSSQDQRYHSPRDHPDGSYKDGYFSSR